MKIQTLAFVVLTVLSTSVTCAADQRSFYVTAGLYRANYDVDSFKETDKGLFAVDLGYSIYPNFAVEVGYQDFGEISVPGSSAIRAEVQAYQISLLGYFPLRQAIIGYLKAGVDFWEVKVPINTDFSALTLDDSSDDAFYGVGAEWVVDEQTLMFVEYQFHSSAELQTYGLGVKYYFGQ